MVDLSESPAVPPFDPKGDERLGYFLAGGLLIAVGWGVALVLNILLHRWAAAGATHLWTLRVGARWGPEGIAVALFGAATGAVGVVLVLLGRESPRGPIVLPGAEY